MYLEFILSEWRKGMPTADSAVSYDPRSDGAVVGLQQLLSTSQGLEDVRIRLVLSDKKTNATDLLFVLELIGDRLTTLVLVPTAHVPNAYGLGRWWFSMALGVAMYPRGLLCLFSPLAQVS